VLSSFFCYKNHCKTYLDTEVLKGLMQEENAKEDGKAMIKANPLVYLVFGIRRLWFYCL